MGKNNARAWEIGAASLLVLAFIALGARWFGVEAARKRVNRDLLQALERRDVEAVRQCVRRGGDPHLTHPEYGTSVAMVAAEAGDLDLLRRACEPPGKLDVNAGNARHATALVYAARVGKTEAAKLLLHYGADPNEVDDANRSPLIWAAANDNPAMIEVLVQGGADIEHRDGYGDTPLTMAARSGRAANVKALLKAGADPKRIGWADMTALQLAHRLRREEVTRVLAAKPGAKDR